MSIFQRLLGGSKKDDSKNVSSASAIKQLSDVEEMLTKRQLLLESQIEEEKVNALSYSKQGNKRGALMAIKRKKKHEKMLIQLDGTLTTLEIQKESLQNASTNMEVLRVMKQAAGALKKTHQDLDVDQVHDLMDDLAEQQHLDEEIVNALSSLGPGQSDLYSDADLEQELELLAQNDIKQDIIHIGPLPDVPQTIPTKQENDPLREFEAWTT